MSANLLMGMETEYAVSAHQSDGRPVDHARVIGRFFQDATERLVHLNDPHAMGMFLGNGARLYNDQSHPEYCTPECDNPWDVVRCQLAGDRIVLDLSERMQRGGSLAAARVPVYKGNVDYGDDSTVWGCHESYQHRTTIPRLQLHLIPHLVSRIIYTGAGGFNSRFPGIGYLVSPRVPHLESAVSNASTEHRGIFHTKDEPLNGAGYHRLHLLCGESNGSQRSSVLKLGVTGLIVALIDAGLEPARDIVLTDPLEAMTIFTRDPACSQKVTRDEGDPISALEIQRHYLDQVRANLDQAIMPDWAPEICDLWEDTLEELERDDPDLQKSLDWKIKRAIYDSFIQGQGFNGAEINRWNRFIGKVLVDDSPVILENGFDDPQTPEEILAWLEDPRGPLLEMLRQEDLSPVRFLRFMQLRQELLELDTRFLQLGEEGVFSRLEAEGVLDHRQARVTGIEEAVSDPPGEGRAWLRGRSIQELVHAEGNYRTTWDAIIDFEKRRILQLKDPFATSAEWEDLAQEEEALELGFRLPQRQSFLRVLMSRGF